MNINRIGTILASITIVLFCLLFLEFQGYTGRNSYLAALPRHEQSLTAPLEDHITISTTLFAGTSATANASTVSTTYASESSAEPQKVQIPSPAYGLKSHTKAVVAHNKTKRFALNLPPTPFYIEFVEIVSKFPQLVLIDIAILRCYLSKTEPCQNKTTGMIEAAIPSGRISSLRSWVSQGILKKWESQGSQNHTLLWNNRSRQYLIRALEDRSDYWFLPAVQSLGIFQQAFLKDDLERINVTVQGPSQKYSTTVLVPRDVELFIWQQQYSEFRDCDIGIRDKFYKAYPNERTAERKVSDEKFLKTLYVRDLLVKKHRAIAMLSSGTALGWYRQCGIISYTHDADFMFPAKQYTPELLTALRCDSELRFNHFLGEAKDSLEVSVIRGGLMIDVFLLYESANSTYISTVDYNGYKKLREVYPPLKGIVSVDLLGHLFWIPKNIDEFIRSAFGDTWNQPVRHYVWFKSPKNLKVVGRWTPSEWKRLRSRTIPCPTKSPLGASFPTRSSAIFETQTAEFRGKMISRQSP